MSVDFNMYLGIYIECEKVYKEIEHKIKICSKCKVVCSTRNYCSNCGNNIKKNTEIKITKESISIDFSEEIEDNLNEEIVEVNNNYSDDKERNIYVLNGGSDLDEEENNFIDFSDYDCKTQILTFMYKFKKLINFFEKNYKNKYKVKYGLVTYYS